MKKNYFVRIISIMLALLSTACTSTPVSDYSETVSPLVTEVTTTDTTIAQTEELLSSIWTTKPTEEVTNVWTTTATTAVSSEVSWSEITIQKNFDEVPTTASSKIETSEESVTTVKTTAKVSESTNVTAETKITADTSTTVAETDVVEDSLRVVLPVENIQQLPELPAGCEITSTTIALNYELGITESKMDMVSYLPMDKWPDENSVWSSPWDVFVGDPSLNYYGAYSPVIKKTLENYFKKNNLDKEYKVTDLSGSSVSELYDYIDDGHPIIVWATIKMKASKPGNSWYLEDGSKYTWIAGEHCLVLIGYDLEKDTVILSDPYDSRGTVEYSTETFEARYEELFKQALIIEKIEK